jgi:hypothetical protein
MKVCGYRYCNKEIKYGRKDRNYCNDSCKSKELAIKKELKSLNMRVVKTKEFIERAKIKHNNKYNYDLTIYINCREKVKIICPTHGEFEQKASNHLYNGYGCEQCSRDAHRLSILTEDRVNKLKEIHSNKYIYNNLNVNKGFINITCPEHGIFTQYLYFHEYGHGCIQCNASSRGENIIKNYLDNSNIKYIRNHTFANCKRKKKLKFDFYLSDFRIIIEYDGEHHYKENKYFGVGNLKYVAENDNIKNKYCQDNNIKIIRIPYYKFDSIKNLLDNFLLKS